MSQFSRFTLSVDTDTGVAADTTKSDTGPAIFGQLVQMAWMPSDGDSGADLILSQIMGIPADTGPGDTGDELIFFNDNDCLSAAGFYRVPMLMSQHSDGLDTGADQQRHVTFAGERIRAKVVGGQAECHGKLIFWVKK